MALNYQAAVNISAQFTGQKAFDQVKTGLNQIGDSAKTSGGRLESLLSAGLKRFATVFAVSEVVQFSKSIIDLGDELNDLRQKTGIGVQALSALKGAAELNGLSFEGLQTSLRKFSSVIGNASSGSREALAGFNALGLSIRNASGEIKPSNQLLGEIADRFENMKDGPEKAAIAIRLFGKSGSELIPLLNNGRAELEKYGLVISDQFAAQADLFNDNLTLMKKSVQQFGVSVLSEALPSINQIIDEIKRLPPIFGGVSDSFGILEKAIAAVGSAIIIITQRFGAMFDFVKAGVQEMGEIWSQLGKQFVNFANLFGSVMETRISDFGRLKQIFSQYASSASGDFKGFVDNSKNIGNQYLDSIETRAKRSKESIEKLFSGPEAAPIKKPNGGFNPDLSGFNTGEKSKYDKEAEAIERLMLQKDELIRMNELEADRINMTEAEYNKKSIALKESIAAEREVADWNSKNTETYRAVTQEIIAQKQALIDLQEEQKRSFSAGAKEAWKDYLENARDVASQTKGMFTRAFTGMEDAIIEFAQTGKLSFAKLAAAIEADLIRIAFRQAIVFGATSLLGGVFGGGIAPAPGALGGPGATAFMANGGVMTDMGPLPLNKYSTGGIANSPQVAVFGEGRMAEAFVPLPDGRSIPVKMDGASGGGTSVVVNVNINSNGSDEQSSASEDQKGKALGNLIAAAVKNELLQQKRPGGLLT